MPPPAPGRCVSQGPVIPPAALARARTPVSIKEGEESAPAVSGAVGAQPGTESPAEHQGDFLEEVVFVLGLREMGGACRQGTGQEGPGASKRHPDERFIRFLEQLLNPDPGPELGCKWGPGRFLLSRGPSRALAGAPAPLSSRPAGPAPQRQAPFSAQGLSSDSAQQAGPELTGVERFQGAPPDPA